MTDKAQQRPVAEDHHPDAPWWWGIGPVGAAGLVVVGIVAFLWLFVGLPGTPEDATMTYYSAGKVAAVGLVIAGTAALGRFRSRASGGDEDTASGES